MRQSNDSVLFQYFRNGGGALFFKQHITNENWEELKHEIMKPDPKTLQTGIFFLKD